MSKTKAQLKLALEEAEAMVATMTKELSDLRRFMSADDEGVDDLCDSLVACASEEEVGAIALIVRLNEAHRRFKMRYA